MAKTYPAHPVLIHRPYLDQHDVVRLRPDGRVERLMRWGTRVMYGLDEEVLRSYGPSENPFSELPHTGWVHAASCPCGQEQEESA